MAIDTPARHIYEGDGFTRVFPIPTYIQGDDYIRIEIDGEYQADRSLWDIVNNSIIFTIAPIDGSSVDVQVATSIEALSELGNSTNVDIVAASIVNVNNVGNSIDNVAIVADNISNINIVGEDISKVINVSNNIEEVKALNASIEDGVLPFERVVITVNNIDELLELSPSNGDTVIVKDNNRGGIFIYDATQSAINNSGTIFNGWARQYSGVVNVKWFGAKGDGLTDDTLAIQNAILSISPFPRSSTSHAEIATIRELSGELSLGNSGLYRVTDTIIIPAGLKVTSGSMYFNNNADVGAIWYDGIATKPAVATLTYKNNSGTYTVYTDYKNIPSGIDYDNGLYVNVAKNINLSFSVITTFGTEVGVLMLGCAGAITDRLSIGENKGSYRLPKVGLVQSAAWGVSHYKLHIVARTQGIYLTGANGGTSFYSPYINRDGSTDTDLETQVFQVASSTGSAGICLDGSSSISFYSPIAEHWWNAFVADGSKFHVTSAHIESANGNIWTSFYLANNSSLICESSKLVHKYLDDTSALIYLENQHTHSCAVDINGFISAYGYTLVRGVNSTACLSVDGALRSQSTNGKLGQSELIKNIEVIDSYINIDPISGDDENYGFHASRAVKTLKKAIELASLYNKDNKFNSMVIRATSTVTLTSDVVLGKTNLIMSGAFDFKTYRLVHSEGHNIHINLQGSYITSINGYFKVTSTAGHFSLYIKGSASIGTSYSLIFVDSMANITLLGASGVDLSTMARVVDYGSSSVPAGKIDGCLQSPVAQCPTIVSGSLLNSTGFTLGY